MTWSYSGDPGLSRRDEVRFLLRDTVQKPESLSDEEIGYLLQQDPDNTMRAAGRAAERMATFFVGQSLTSKRVGDLTLSYDYSQTAARYSTLAVELMKGPAVTGAAPVTLDTHDYSFQIGMGEGGDYSTDRRVQLWN